jgi:hypothetical protein
MGIKDNAVGPCHNYFAILSDVLILVYKSNVLTHRFKAHLRRLSRCTGTNNLPVSSVTIWLYIPTILNI